MKKKKKQDGVVFKKRRSGKIDKEIYTFGYLQRRYKDIPQNLKFKSPMVNDINQDLCGGWFTEEWPTPKAIYYAIVSRIIAGQKPLGEIFVDTEDELMTIEKIATRHKLNFTVKYRKSWDDCQVRISRKGKLKDLFDMDSLCNDYAKNNLIWCVQELTGYADADMITFHDEEEFTFDNHYPLTGLILGYPVENTIVFITE